ncbi:ESX secretion-associated protein EspG [Mycobacterium sp. AZCC_0083]|uniref:ESX secretion-associated protein EspG n=1 Tax=Mycobacterium sp. AZCC_0083 TaxID=2735882 RepID=UPI001617C1A3|nr:ESX secretion-associated protein EspG [Mycobacterium sp. AZCC_0083]MBB5167576.1 hypothetical protein [Mycobacterium sp. AZCC_0083]
MSLRSVGAIDLVDFDAICEYYGRDVLPYPFRFTQPTRFASDDAARAYRTTVPDRLHHGDLSVFGECVAAYFGADIRVEYHVQHIPSDTASGRVIACRQGQFGFVLEQRPDSDVIDVSAVSPFDLGAAVSDAVPLTQPGRYQRIVVPKYRPRPQPDFDTNDIQIFQPMDTPSEVMITEQEVSAYATVQSHWRPARNWGLERTKQSVLWIRVIDDGEYVFTPDAPYAVPMTQPALRERIDRLICDDIAVLRQLRSDRIIQFCASR